MGVQDAGGAAVPGSAVSCGAAGTSPSSSGAAAPALDSQFIHVVFYSEYFLEASTKSGYFGLFLTAALRNFLPTFLLLLSNLQILFSYTVHSLKASILYLYFWVLDCRFPDSRVFFNCCSCTGDIPSVRRIS